MATKAPYYLFAPGTFGYYSALARYKRNVKLCNGEWLVSQQFAEVFPDDANVVVVKFAEIQGEDDKESKWPHSFVVDACHTLFDQSIDYQIDLQKYNLGQHDDIKLVETTYQSIVNADSEAEIVCFGASRGAAAIFSWLACSPKSNIAHVKSVILEGMPCSIETILDHSTGLHYVAFKLASILLPMLTNYKRELGHPIDFMHNFPRHIPMLLITSEKDKIVPSESIINLYRKFVEGGFRNVDILVLDNSDHSNYTTRCESDIQMYLKTVKPYITLSLPRMQQSS